MEKKRKMMKIQVMMRKILISKPVLVPAYHLSGKFFRLRRQKFTKMFPSSFSSSLYGSLVSESKTILRKVSMFSTYSCTSWTVLLTKSTFYSSR